MDRSARAELLLAGPRGRRMCLWLTEVAVFGLQVAQLDVDSDTAAAADSGSSIRWVHDLPVTPEVVNAMDAAIRTAWTARSGRGLTERELFDALADTAAVAMYWQPPDDDDQVIAEPVVTDALAAVARAATASPATLWWDRAAPLDDQHFVSWIRTPRGRLAEPPALTGSTSRLRAWRTLTSGSSRSMWWSTPDAVSTSASRGLLPATQLELVEDTMGFERARVARLQPADSCRVLELITPGDWIALVDSYPLDVTRARDASWPEVTGGRGPWFLPDWSAVSNDYDAVHLTVLAYLSTAGRALPCRGGATVVAGWEPDVTYWLTDCLTQAEPPTTWINPTDDEGRRPRWIREQQAAGPVVQDAP